MEHNVTLNCDIYNACRTNTARARKNDMHYDFPMLAKISGARFEDVLVDLQYCAEHSETELAVNVIQRFAEALLSAYEIQESTYGKK